MRSNFVSKVGGVIIALVILFAGLGLAPAKAAAAEAPATVSVTALAEPIADAQEAAGAGVLASIQDTTDQAATGLADIVIDPETGSFFWCPGWFCRRDPNRSWKGQAPIFELGVSLVSGAPVFMKTVLVTMR